MLNLDDEVNEMETVKVGVCIRPMSKDEKAKGSKSSTRVDGSQLKVRFGDGREKTFTWDFGVCIVSRLVISKAAFVLV